VAQILALLLTAAPKLVELFSRWWENNGKQIQAWWIGKRGQRQRDEVESLGNTQDVLRKVGDAHARQVDDSRRDAGRFSDEWLRRGSSSKHD